MTKKWQKYFITGLIVIIPIWFTIYFLYVIFLFTGQFLKPIVQLVFQLFVAKEYLPLYEAALKIASFFVTIGLVILTGFFANWFLGKKFLIKVDSFFTSVPIVRGIYKSLYKLTQIVFGTSTTFQRVVIVEFPQPGMYAIGFITNESKVRIPAHHKPYIGVFVPKTPNPATGFFLVVDEKKVIPTSMGIDEGIKIIVSGGIIGVPQEKIGKNISADDSNPEPVKETAPQV